MAGSGQLTQKGANRAVLAGLGKAQAAASGMYLGLLTALPANPDTDDLAAFAANEVTTAGYARQAVDWVDPPTGDPSKTQNTADITFGPFSADPPNVTHVMLCTTSLGTAGDVLAYWQWGTPRDGNVGDSLQIAAGDLTLSVD